jgi:hypothetical protein
VVSSPPIKYREITYPSIPEPGQDVESLQATVLRLKEAVEMLTGQRGPPEAGTVGIFKELRGFDSRVYELWEADQGLARIVQGVEASGSVAIADLASDLADLDTELSGDIAEVSASGQMVLSAEVNPTGYKAYFGVYLRATVDSVPGTLRRAGMHLGLTNADGGVFALDVDKFIIRDSGSAAESSVFTYGSGVFTMTGNVTINGSLMVTNTITGAKLVDLTTPTEKVAYNAVGQFYQTTGGSWSFGSGWNTVASRTIVGITGGYVFLLGVVTVNAAPAGSTTFGVRIRRTSDGSIIKEAPLSVMASGDYAVAGPVATTVGGFHSDGGSNYTYELQVNTGGISLTGTLVEFSVEVRKR